MWITDDSTKAALVECCWSQIIHPPTSLARCLSKLLKGSSTPSAFQNKNVTCLKEFSKKTGVCVCLLDLPFCWHKSGPRPGNSKPCQPRKPPATPARKFLGGPPKLNTARLVTVVTGCYRGIWWCNEVIYKPVILSIQVDRKSCYLTWVQGTKEAASSRARRNFSRAAFSRCALTNAAWSSES